MLQEFLDKNKIDQIYISESIIDNKLTTLKNIKYNEYNSIDKPALFWGVYRDEDRKAICNHKGKKWIFWGGNDAMISNNVRLEFMKSDSVFNTELHLCNTNTVYNNLIQVFNNVYSFDIVTAIKNIDSIILSDEIIEKFINSRFILLKRISICFVSSPSSQ